LDPIRLADLLAVAPPLSDEDTDRVATVTGSRASALAWLLGEE